MKKVLIVIASIYMLVILNGCSNEKIRPQDSFVQYMEYWSQQEFDKMYGLLSADAKNMTKKEEFIVKYEKMYKELKIANLELAYEAKTDKDYKYEDTAAFPFTAEMDSAAGKIAFKHTAMLIKEKRDKEIGWYIDWDTSYIFPELEEDDQVRYISKPAERGEIVDRTGDLLAFNGTLYEIGVVPEKMGEQRQQTIASLAKVLYMTEEAISSALEANWVRPEHFVPLKRVSPNNRELLDKAFALPGVLKQDVKGRIYPAGESAAHLIGYVGKITAEELEKHKDKGYTSNDFIGKRGLEQVLEERLKGKNGAKIFIEKSDGSEVILAEEQVKDGEDIQLTIDLTLQEDIYTELSGKPGMASAIDPVTGETLALVSSPGFDPNAASLGMAPDRWKALEEHKDQPLLNRFRYNYVPGSVIKPITGAIALSEGVLLPEKKQNIQGLRWQKDTTWGSYKVTRVKNPGVPVDFDQAMMYSDNIYFAQLSLKLGKEKFAEGLKKFAFEEKIPFSYPLESSHIGKLDTEIKIADSGYGQGEVEMNILHLAATYTAFINKGNMIKPVLLAEEELKQVWKEKIMSEKDAKVVENAMKKVVHEPGGTARSARMEDYPLAGKTGTAELKLNTGMKGQENGLFVAYNPDEPSLLIAMMAEGVEKLGGSGIVVEKVKRVFEKNKERF